MGLAIGLKEWSAVVQALGKGRQTLMLRGYPSKYAEFFLYPTYSYLAGTKSNPDRVDDRFQSRYRDMARKCGEITRERAKDYYADIEYWAQLDEVIPVGNSDLSSLTDYFIWSPKHVEDYKALCTRGLFVWIVRINRFSKRVEIGREAGGGIPNYYTHPEELSTFGSMPVLSDLDYDAKKKIILSKTRSIAV